MRVALMIGLILSASLVGAPMAQAQSTVDPSWLRSSNPDLASALMPGFATALGVSASALIECRVVEDGHPFTCRVVSETVPGLGFGAAARLVVASGELRTRHVDGRPASSVVRSNVRFVAPPIARRGKTWTGPHPSEEALRLASRLVETMPESAFPSMDDAMDGLDHDRRAVVRPWVEELILPSHERMRQVRAIQLARLFSEADLRGILDGRFPAEPSEEELINACPELTTKEAAAFVELRRRYCERYECGF